MSSRNTTISGARHCSRFVSAWVIGGGVWLLGMFALMVVPMIATDVNAGVTASPAYYSHSGNWTTVTDPSGKYTAVVRQMVPAPKP